MVDQGEHAPEASTQHLCICLQSTFNRVCLVIKLNSASIRGTLLQDHQHHHRQLMFMHPCFQYSHDCSQTTRMT